VALEEVLRRAPLQTRFWIDETYVDYLAPAQSLERFATGTENVIVCKSMSKVYALSGARVAYLCAGPHQLESLRAVTPPWAVSLPAQIAAVRALGDPSYYQARHTDTRQLREELRTSLQTLGLDVTPGCANFILGHLPTNGPTATEIVGRCRLKGVFLRDAGATSTVLGTRAIRVAVKDATSIRRIVDVLKHHHRRPGAVADARRTYDLDQASDGFRVGDRRPAEFLHNHRVSLRGMNLCL
jgi:histidinol-phosphate/aromatic aminotransferase/cobyric acid decarboxylase-like protein